MKLHKDIKIESVCSKDKARYAISEPYLDITDGNGTLVSTNGKALAVVPVDINEHDVAGYVCADGLKAARKAASKRGDAELTANGDIRLANGLAMPRTGNAGECNYPNWKAVIPDFTGKQTVSIAIDAAMLMDLAKAIGTQGVKLTFAVDDTGKPAGTAIKVTPTSAGVFGSVKPACDNAHGIIMPIRTE